MDLSKPVVFVVGPTASGKSEWALKWARDFHGVVVNCDSVQVYRSLDIGAAKPSAEERAQVPHLLYDYVAEGESMTAGQYSRDFFHAIEAMPSAPAFVTGGTGFYFQAIEKGMYPVRSTPSEIQQEIADILQSPGGPEGLYAEFQKRDPQAAAKIHPQDHYRLGRAMELIRAEGKTLTEIREEFARELKAFPYPLLKIGRRWSKELLQERVRRRTQSMVRAGLVEEVRALLDRGLGGWPALQSVGYKEVLQFLREGKSLAWLEDEIVKNTQSLIKRQKTWFQRDPEIQWFAGDEGFAEATRTVSEFLQRTRP